MRQFTDGTGKQWMLDINIGTVRRIKAQSGIDPLNLKALLDRISTDQFIIVDMLYAAIDHGGMTHEQFSLLFKNMDTVEAATDALLREIADFCQSRQRPLLAKTLDLIERAKAVETAANQKALVTLDGLLSTSSPASLESTPTPSPSGS